MEDSSIVRMPSQVLEKWSAVYAFERWLCGPNCLLRRAAWCRDKMRAQHHGKRSDRLRMIAP